MKIVILSQDEKLYSTSRLVESARQRGHEAQVINYLRCYMNIAPHDPQVIVSGRAVRDVDAVIPRIAASKTFYGTAVVRQFEMAGVYTLNRSVAISRSRDKLRCLQILASEGIDLPVTGFAHATKDIGGLIDVVGDAPLVVKLLEGTQGIGVVLCETRQAAESVIEAFRGLDANILVQKFIAEARGADIRAFVVGDKVVAAMLRQGRAGEFRSNLHRGGSAVAVKLAPDERRAAVRAAKAMGLRMAGVDMLRAANGPAVIEVNSSPGLEGIETATGIDVAGKIIEHIERHARPGRKRDRLQA